MHVQPIFDVLAISFAVVVLARLIQTMVSICGKMGVISTWGHSPGLSTVDSRKSAFSETRRHHRLDCGLRARWRVASVLRCRAAISEPKVFFLWEFSRFWLLQYYAKSQ